MHQIKILFAALLLVFLASCINASSQPAPTRWWPQQKVPAAIVKTIPHESFEKASSPNGKTTQGHIGSVHMMIQSLSGLAARAVNAGTCDEMIWIEVGNDQGLNPNYALNYKLLEEQLGFEERGQFGSWELVERFIKKGVVKGYVLYRFDYSEGQGYSKRDDADHSSNVATIAAAAEGAILIEEGLEARAKSLGLELLYDARDKTVKEVFERYKDKLNRNFYVSIDPKIGHCRDFAIAYGCAVGIGMDDPTSEILEWLEPMSPIIGYVWGDEFQETAMYCRWGHYVTATNWSLNLPLMIAAGMPHEGLKVKSVDPKTIDFEATPHACAFVLSDGDNMCWFAGDFVFNRYYWDTPLRQEIPFSWTTCFANLAQAGAVVTETLIDNQPMNSGFIEYGGGYQYPDLFAVNRPNRTELVKKFARRTWQWMESMDITVFGFLTENFDSPNAIEAYEIYAREMPGLTGMIAVQYAPYEGGPNQVVWVKNKEGIEIPVVQASYALWSRYNSPNGGTPSKVARLVNENANNAKSEGGSSYDWVVVHAWSGFQKSQTNDEEAENGDYKKNRNESGLAPTAWTIERLNPGIKPVTIEELLWLIRMEHNPDQTRNVINDMK